MVNGKLVEVSVDDGPRLLVEALRRLDQEGLSPSSINLHEPSLDDVFLAITGRRATVETTDEDAGDDAESGTTGDAEPARGRRARARRLEKAGAPS